MRLSGRGIGWLIAGVFICTAATEAEDISGAVSTIAIGLVFAAIYFMKQRFDPEGLGWWIAGGILMAFCLEGLLDIAFGFVSKHSILPGDLSDMLIGFIIAVICLFVFYRKNKEELEDTYYEDVVEDDAGYLYQEEIVTEETVTVEHAEET